MSFLLNHVRASLPAFLIFLGGCQTVNAPTPPSADAGSFRSLDRFESVGGHLDLRLRARATTALELVQLGDRKVISHVYEVCRIDWQTRNQTVDSQFDAARCGKNLYGGPLIAVKQGDVVRIQLVNDLPPLHYDQSNEAGPLAGPVEESEPTNIHTHGLVVRPYSPAPEDRLADDPANGTFGDFAFVKVDPNAGCGAGMGPMHHAGMGSNAEEHAGMPSRCRTADYEIAIPGHPGESSMERGEHPSGIFWIHPHFHSLAKEQVSGGMTAMLSIGQLADYACAGPRTDGTCDRTKPLPPQRELLLKDIQVIDNASGGTTSTVLYDQDAGFCVGTEDAANPGGCSKADGTGKWYFTVNGAVDPHWNIPAGTAEVWRIQNASANLTYDLQLTGAGWDDGDLAGGMPFQVLSLDGVGLGLSGSTQQTGAAYFINGNLQRRAILMPGSRVEIVVALRPKAGCRLTSEATTIDDCAIATSPHDSPIRLITRRYATGPDADVWPHAQLAEATLLGTTALANQTELSLVSKTSGVAQPVGTDRIVPGRIFTNSATRDMCRSGNLYTLKAGERRRIYFAIVSEGVDAATGASTKARDPHDPNWRPETFVLGHSYIDSQGVERDPATGQTLPDGPVLRSIDMRDARSDLCIAYDQAQRPSRVETWELVNISPEVHNFHIHQNRFEIARLRDANGTVRPAFYAPDPADRLNLPQVIVNVGEDRAVLHDTIIVPRGAANCSTDIDGAAAHFVKLDDGSVPGDNRYRIRPGTCRGNAPTDQDAGWIQIRLAFNRSEQIGKYVFHCHILEHEDLGMMASIRVLSPDQLAMP